MRSLFTTLLLILTTGFIYGQKINVDSKKFKSISFNNPYNPSVVSFNNKPFTGVLVYVFMSPYY